MRIIGGTAARRLLKAPSGYAVRPTPDRVKQAVFNSLGDFVSGASVLELFAGTGALGLECLSRGAHRLVAVEKSDRQARFIRENARTAQLDTSALSLRIQDVFPALSQLLAEGERFQLILADPPYGEKNSGHRSRSLAQALLDAPALLELLAENGLFVLGHAKRDQLTLPPSWKAKKSLEHGDNRMLFLFKSPTPPGSPDPATPADPTAG
ncbi:MAG: methyltransferase [Verrucomicrobia bacterium]|nr:methyltransferase [Verrucomicrobiota bacterium]